MTRWTLPPGEIPSAWFNVAPYLRTPLQPPLHPATREPVGPDDLAPLFAAALIEQEMTTAPWIDVPGEVLDILRLWRPTPLVRAVRLERALGTTARIYYKDESGSPAGSHKPNTAVAQAFYNAREGLRRLTTETGAGQWGTALAFACAQFGLECQVYMVRTSFEQKPYRRVIMETWGGSVVPSPVDQTVIGLEVREQLILAGERLPDVVIAPCGGGSNLGGICLPFVPETGVRLLAVEPLSCPTLTQGRFDYDFGDSAGLTPLLAMHTLGHDFVPPSIHAGGLRYHGNSPLISALVRDGRISAVAYPQGKVFEAAVQFARIEGKVAAPEAAHAIRAVIDEALTAKETGEEKVILFNYCGHGFLDLSAYDDYLHGRLPDEQG